MLRIPFGVGDDGGGSTLPQQVKAMTPESAEDNDDEVVMGRVSRRHGNGMTPPSCFDVFAGLWVFLYERYIPTAHRDAQQAYLVDELNSTTARLRTRRDELQQRVKAHAIDAKRALSRGDKRGFQSRMASARRLRMQADRIEVSLSTIEGNIDEIINSDVTRDIIDSLRRSTEALKGQVVPMGGVEGVQEVVDDLQSELATSQEVMDAIYRNMPSGAADLDGDESLVSELNAMLRDSGEDEIMEDDQSLEALLGPLPRPNQGIQRQQQGDDTRRPVSSTSAPPYAALA